MSTHLENLKSLKSAEQQLRLLTDIFPNLDLSLDHRLRVFFPRLPADACTDFLFINQASEGAPGQSPVIISQQLTALIDECLLSGQIPTFVQGATRVYNYAYTLDDQDVATGINAPELEKYLEFVVRTPELCVRDALSDFWQTPHPDLKDVTPQSWISQYALSLILNEARVRHADTTLSPTGLQLVEYVFAAPAQPRPAELYGFYTVALNGHPVQDSTALYGAFVITTKNLPKASAKPHDRHIVQDATPRPVVLFTPNNGLETFDSLHALTQELSARLKDPYQRERLFDCVLAEHRVRAMAHVSAEYSPVTDSDVPTFYSAQLISKQQRDMRHAWSVARTLKQDTTFDQLSECTDQSIATSLALAPANIVLNRYTLMLEKQFPKWLKNASDEDKSQWRLNVERLNYERQASVIPDSEPLSEIGQKHTLLGFARLRLQQQIKKDHGIDVDPDAVFVSTTEAVRTGPLINPISGSGFAAGFSLDRTGPVISHKTTRRSLSELALANVGIWDLTFALTARVKDGADNPHPVLTTDYVKTLVRQLDIGENYKKKLNDLLVNSKQAQWRKERYVAFKKAQMHLDLLEATLSGALSADQAARVKIAMDHPVEKNRPLLNGEQVVVHLLKIRYKSLPGLLVFSFTGSYELLCYTPGAPGNRWFLVATSRNDLGLLLSSPQWRPYVMSRIRTQQKPYVKPLLEQGLTDSNLQLQSIGFNLFEASYDSEAMNAIHEADEQSTSTWESNLNTAKETALTVLDIMSFVLPARVLLPIVLGRFLYQIMQGIDALQRDEKHEALLQFMESISHLTDAASDFTGSAIFGAAIRQRIRQPRAVLSPAATSTPASTGLKLRTGEEFGAGVFESAPTSDGQTLHYTKHGQSDFYRSQYDTIDEFWRALDERKPNAVYSTPLRELSAGKWDVDPAAPLLMHKPGIERLIESAKVSNVDLNRFTPDDQGIYRVNNMRYIQQHGVVFEVYSGWLGRNWYLQLPARASSNISGRYKVRRTAGEWQIKHKLADNTKRWEPLTRNRTTLSTEAAHTPYSDFDIPAQYQETLYGILKNHPNILKGDRDFMDVTSDLSIAHRAFKDMRVKLLTEAKAHFATQPAKPRVACPHMPENTSPQALFKRLHEQSQGIVLGEAHAHQSGKKLLIDNMAELAKNDVKVLYLEHLQTDMHQRLLNDYVETGKMPLRLDEFLKDQDLGHRIDPSSRYNISQLVREARRHGIEVRALDCASSYNEKGTPSPTPWLTRYEMFSYFAARVIRTHQASRGNPKWIALTGNTHANTFQGIPGLAELEGAIGLRVSDTTPGTSQGLRQAVGEVVPPATRGLDHHFLKNDYWLQIDIPDTKPRPAAFSPAQTNDRLKEPGHFRVDNDSADVAQLIHRSSSREIIYTPLQTDANGLIFIERPSWPTIHQKRYGSLNELIRDLQSIHSMTQLL